MTISKRHTPPETAKRVMELLDQGLTVPQICRRISITPSSAKRIQQKWRAKREQAGSDDAAPKPTESSEQTAEPKTKHPWRIDAFGQ